LLLSLALPGAPGGVPLKIMNNTPLPSVLIEDWLPIEAIGAESKRERGASSALPPLYFLHVWWARRPLTTSRAAILASVLPQWSPDWPEPLRQKFPTQEAYHNWFVYLTGIRGDPVAGRKLVDWAEAKGIKLQAHPYGGAPRAFTVNPSAEDLQTMGDLLEHTWGTRELSVLDPFAGGGSIPFEALRYGFTTIANDLNPVAATILKATLDYPARFGPELAEDIKKWGNIWAKRVEEKLADYFPKQGNESIFAYLWARTVACPTTGKPVPLSPNWWLSKGSDPVAVKLIAEPEMDAPRFAIVTEAAVEGVKSDEGTISRGVGRSPWTGETIPGDYIKSEAQAGRMGQILYAIAVKKSGSGFDFRAPVAEDLTAVVQAEVELAHKKPGWIFQDLIPTEQIPIGSKTAEPIRYGIFTWADAFSPRQLLVLGTFMEGLRELENEIRDSYDDLKTTAIISYLALALDKCPNYNSRMSIWHALRTRMVNTFNRHDFAFAWSHGEFDGASNLLPWALEQTVKAYREMAEMAAPAQRSWLTVNSIRAVERLAIRTQTANDLPTIKTDSILNITVDPPYYDNVQYAELADFFYVWLKRSVGHLFPEFYTDELTNKDDEAVANPARFESMGRKKKALAEQDYERKMAAAFREMHRVLHPHGVLTVMFTHKRVEAWDTLASALIGAGFVIKASWPVHTESEHSLHQAKKNAAASTILLVCRKRDPRGVGHPQMPADAASEDADSSENGPSNDPVWWDDIQGRVRRVAREKAREYLQQGISGVDLYISVFGPTLSVISEQWPVLTSEIDPKSGQPKPLRPETALDLAREEVVRLRKEGLLAGRAIEFDPITDWYLMAWDAFQAEEFPYDEARKLAIALGLEMDELAQKKLIAKKSASVVLQQPKERRKKGTVDPEVAHFEHLLDALHTALLIYEEDGAGACDVFLQNRGLKRDSAFKAGLQAMINAIPRARIKGIFIRPEADVLDRLRLAFYADELTVPPEEEPPLPQAQQLGLSFDAEEYDEDEGDQSDEE
jgi:putative DNA methylase